MQRANRAVMVILIVAFLLGVAMVAASYRAHQSQRRAEVDNRTNTPHSVTPPAQLANPAVGPISSTGNSIPRQMQFAATLIF